MIIQHNLSALNANRQLNIVGKTGSKSVEKLSSGYRINRAADDAAGLSISEKMRRQIRGLTKAVENVEDGISLCQVADGAMAEMQDMTNRMNELCVQAANGTNSASDRSYIQMEIDSIVAEFDRIITTTRFNETYIFKGDEEYSPDFIEILGNGIGSVKGVKAWADDKLSSHLPQEYTNDYNNHTNNWATTTNTPRPNAGCAWIDFTDFTAGSKQELIQKLNGEGFDSTCGAGCGRYYGIKFVKGHKSTDVTDQSKIPYTYNYYQQHNSEILSISLDDLWTRYTNQEPTQKCSLGEMICATLIETINDAGEKYKSNSVHHPGYNSFLTAHSTAYSYQKGTAKFYISTTGGSGERYKYSPVPRDITGAAGQLKAIGERVIMPKRQLAVQAGTDTDLANKISMRLPTMSKESLRLDKISVLTEDFATNSIEILNDTLRFISEDRSRIGAYQNRLEHSSLNLDNIVENTTDSESKIRDTDMADEMVRYSNINILTQAGQSILSQANNSAQGVLSLLTA